MARSSGRTARPGDSSSTLTLRPSTRSAMPRDKIILACSDCKNRNYFTTKNKRLHPERVEWKKYCPRCNKHQASQGNQVMADAVARPGAPVAPAVGQRPGLVTRLVDFYHGVMAEMKQGDVAGPAAGSVGDHRDHHLRADPRPVHHDSRLRRFRESSIKAIPSLFAGR